MPAYLIPRNTTDAGVGSNTTSTATASGRIVDQTWFPLLFVAGIIALPVAIVTIWAGFAQCVARRADRKQLAAQRERQWFGSEPQNQVSDRRHTMYANGPRAQANRVGMAL
ncbi:hypothetical protein EJ03DRAFT_326282 [Teratosphaeria nubilosa]|uniref:Uncharacterized protein n=1 Tax=Teratosphaeria nubilosa TaxID=161662 RepID=A0A6G1LCP3_9PEZI|nr:hypothetical protein EJ03DRAFT_326282 [Teratosphaeria nubilosa]